MSRGEEVSWQAASAAFWRGQQARPEQITPPLCECRRPKLVGPTCERCGGFDYNIWLLLAGRGFGKTRTGGEDMVYFGTAHPDTRLALIGATLGDVRDTMIEGESGCLAVAERYRVVRNYNRSLGEMVLTTGTRLKAFSSDEPERLRGPQHHRLWGDELAAWKYLKETWDQAMFGLRLGRRPVAVITTTPKPLPLVRELVKRDDVYVTRGNTFDNAVNLAPAALAQLRARYEGTRMGRQELYAEILDDIEGAYWSREWFERPQFRLPPPAELRRVVVAMDPAVTMNKDSDYTGLAVLGVDTLDTRSNHGWVLAAERLRETPERCMRRAIVLGKQWGATELVVEKNNGGDYLEAVYRSVARDLGMVLRYVVVHASQGKVARAEPASAIYELGRAHHPEVLVDLEDQLTTYTGKVPGEPSPDLMDALVWAVHRLMLTSGPVFLGVA